jgi:hypothetical protein
MKKKLIKFFIIVNILLTTFNTNILAQNIISGEKLEKLLIEDHIIIHDFRGNPLSNNIELNFYTDKTYLLKGRFPPPPEILGYQHIHPISGTWEIVGFGNYYVRLTDNQTFKDSNKKARLEYIFTDNGNIYFLDQYESTPRRKLYSYRSENKKEKIEKDARRIEEIKEQEQIRLKKLEEEKRQLAIKREQERIKSEQIKKESEERLKKSEEERIKRENEERIRQEKEQLYNNILSLIGIAIVLSFIYYIIKFRKDLSKIFNSLNIKSADKYYLDDKLKNIPTAQGLINKPLKTRKVKNFNINNSKNSKLGIVATFIIFIIFIIFFSHESEPELTWDNRHYGTEKYRIQAVPTWKNCPSHAASGSGTKFLKYINEEIDDCGNKCHPAFEKRIRICLYGEK